MYYARPEQLLIDHLSNVAKKCADFAKDFNAEDFGRTVGMYHDLGKYSQAFQEKLKRENAGKKTDHATAGAKELIKLGPFGEILAYAVIGHHSGLPDTGSEVKGFKERIKRNIPDYTNNEFAYKPDLPERKFTDCFSMQFFIRMLFSCLVDADRLDAGKQATDEYALAGFYEKILIFNSTSKIGMLRNNIREQCVSAAEGSRGLYTLTVPTGGGKTLSSLAFALRHAQKHGHKRIIYAIPYTSIIEQTAKTFREILGEENVLEHHSNYAFEEAPGDESDNSPNNQELHTENWDAPLIVTTNVQFFESLFSARPRRCRKIHNIANSVVILDEAQMLPLPFLEPCKRALQELVNNYNCTIVLMSATKPPHFERATEIIRNPQELEEAFRRTETTKLGEKTDDEIAYLLLQEPQALCIVNTKRHARELAEKVTGSYCLTTNLYPKHRTKLLAEIKSKLEKGETVRVISTQLIEAGVDIDFPAVYRAQCGMDSLAQSAGRCNREGKLECGRVYSFVSKEENLRGYLQRTAALGQISNDLENYFVKLYANENMDKKEIIKEFERSLNFKTVSEMFHLIEDAGTPVIIPADDKARNLIEKLKYAEHKKGILRALRPYTVNARDISLISTENICGMVDVLVEMGYYNSTFGLRTKVEAEAIFA